MKKTNYVANNTAMRWLKRSVGTINVMFQLLDINIVKKLNVKNKYEKD